MISYNFYNLIQNNTYITCYLKKQFSPSVIDNTQTAKSIIDTLWDELDNYCEVFPIDLHDAIKTLKSDVLMSVHTSLDYTSRKPITTNDIFEEIKKVDPALNSSPNSANSERTNLSHKKASLGQAFQNTHYTGQYFDENALLYLSPYWLEASKEFKCFNKLDFYYYIKESSHWPFYPDNFNGMMFSEFLESLSTIFQHYPQEDSKVNFDDIFSAYIFEELFYPVNFMQNVSEYISVFGHLLYDIKSPQREQAIILSRLLFKMPSSLWNMVHDSYYSSLNAYITKPRDITAFSNFNMNIRQIFFYQNLLYPALRTLFGMALYSGLGSDLNKTQEVLHSYIENNLEAFNYYSPLKDQISHIQEIAYPSTQKGKTIKLRDGVDKKRNNKALDSFERNFTYNFYCTKHIPNLFEYWWMTGNPNITFESYLAQQIPLYFSNCVNVTSGTVTDNYLRLEARKAQIPGGFIV